MAFTFLQFQPHQQGSDVGLADAGDAAGLTKGAGLNRRELFAGFVGEGADAGVVQIGRQLALALAFHLIDLLLLPLQIAAVFDVNLRAFANLQRQVGVGQAVAHQISGMHAADLVRHGLADADLPLQVREGAEIDIKYSGYLQRQQQQIDQVKRQSQRKLSADLNYAGIGTLSNEAREKLTAIQPSTLGQASRIPGVSKADITALLMWLELQKRERQPLAPTAEAR